MGVEAEENPYVAKAEIIEVRVDKSCQFYQLSKSFTFSNKTK